MLKNIIEFLKKKYNYLRYYNLIQRMSNVNKIDMSKDNNREIEDPMWLPIIKKNEIHFEVVPVKNGIYNPEGIDYNWSQFERYLQLLWEQTGVIPQFGDCFDVPDIYDPENHTLSFWTVVGKSFFVNDFDCVQIHIVPMDVFNKRINFNY